MESARCSPIIGKSTFLDRIKCDKTILRPDVTDKTNRNEFWQPHIDIVINKDEEIILLDLPGVNRKDIRITLSDNILNIEGEKKFVNKNKLLVNERQYGKFMKNLKIPRTIDTENISASYIDGVLQITLPQKKRVSSKKVSVF